MDTLVDKLLNFFFETIVGFMLFHGLVIMLFMDCQVEHHCLVLF